MNYADASLCRHCEHCFRTDQTAPAPDAALPDAELHRTQMFLLPALPQRTVTAAAQNNVVDRLRASLTAAVRSPLLLIAGGLVLVVIVLVILALSLGMIGH